MVGQEFGDFAPAISCGNHALCICIESEHGCTGATQRIRRSSGSQEPNIIQECDSTTIFYFIANVTASGNCTQTIPETVKEARCNGYSFLYCCPTRSSSRNSPKGNASIEIAFSRFLQSCKVKEKQISFAKRRTNTKSFIDQMPPRLLYSSLFLSTILILLSKISSMGNCV